MRKLLVTVLLCMACINSYAQNLVSNGSFETYTTFPSAPAQVTSNCVGWRAYTTGGSPDYMHSCNTTVSWTVPNNVFGWQHAAHGQAYIGFVAYQGPTGSFREYVAAGITPLSIGATYEMSMSVSL